MIWLTLASMYLGGFVSSVFFGYRAAWRKVAKYEETMNKRENEFRERTRSYGPPPGYINPWDRRSQLHPNVIDDAFEILWQPLTWPFCALIYGFIGAVEGGSWCLRRITMPKEIKHRRLPDLREAQR